MTLTKNTFVATAIFALTLTLPHSASAAGAGDRIKLQCPAGAPGSHPCRAVYYWGADGKRHAFPHERVYFTWYTSWSGVQIISATAMAAIPLGKNVTYRPGSKMVKIQTDSKTYAVDLYATLRWVETEAAARELYGENWNADVHVIPDSLFTDYRFGTSIRSSADFNAAERLLAVPTIDADAVYALKQVATSRGNFDAHVITLDRATFRMRTLVAAASDCKNDCPVKPLADYAASAQAGIGIHGTYFCPPDYADCAGKTNTFLSPVYDSIAGSWRNGAALAYHEGPIIAAGADGSLHFYRRTKQLGSSANFQTQHGTPLVAAIANYPALLENGANVVEDESRVDNGMRTIKAVRGALGFNGTKIFLVTARSATMIDLAAIMQALGATDALNLDGGGSAAMLYGGAYKFGPGRQLPNAAVFVRN